MDYNYVRMRDAAAAGDDALAEHYRRLYEAGPEKADDTALLNYIIALLAAVALALGVYIAFFARPAAAAQNTAAVQTEDINSVICEV